MSIDEALILREEAASALPRLREQLNTKLLAKPQPSEEEIFNLISELREESATVEAELRVLGKGRFAPLTGGLGIVVFGVGYAVGAGILPPIAVAGLLALLGQVYVSAHKDDQQERNLTSKPAYALLKAKEILSHREGIH
ncbi:MAG: hypothetical protein WBG50_26365 [Desulfomonilaceae bacterium]